MKKIIIINGLPESGKDEVVKITRDLLKNINIYNYSSVDNIKKIAKESFNWDEIKDLKGRQLLNDLKMAWSNYCEGPFKDVCNFIDKYNEGIFFIHVRESEEIEKLKLYYNDLSIRLLITRDSINKKIYLNYGDSNVFNCQYDYIINNDSTLDELKQNIIIFLKDIGINIGEINE